MFPAIGTLDTIPLDTEEDVRDAWEFVTSPPVVLTTMPWDLKAARERIQLAAVGRDMGILPG